MNAPHASISWIYRVAREVKGKLLGTIPYWLGKLRRKPRGREITIACGNAVQVSESASGVIHLQKPADDDDEGWKRVHLRDPKLAAVAEQPLSTNAAAVLYVIALRGDRLIGGKEVEAVMARLDLSVATDTIKSKIVPRLRKWFIAHHRNEAIEGHKLGYRIRPEYREAAIAVANRYLDQNLTSKIQDSMK